MRDAQPRVLRVEDEAAIRGAVTTALIQAGYLPRAEADGTKLRAVAEAFRPDLAILDIMLPGPDGLCLARMLRDRIDLPILFLTARGGVDDRLAGFAAGADDYLVKPFAMTELIARYTRCCAGLAGSGRSPFTRAIWYLTSPRTPLGGRAGPWT